MIETYIKIKFVEEIIGIVIAIIIIFALLFLFVISHFSDKWEERQNKKSEKFWEEHENENT